MGLVRARYSIERYTAGSNFSLHTVLESEDHWAIFGSLMLNPFSNSIVMISKFCKHAAGISGFTYLVRDEPSAGLWNWRRTSTICALLSRTSFSNANFKSAPLLRSSSIISFRTDTFSRFPATCKRVFPELSTQSRSKFSWQRLLTFERSPFLVASKSWSCRV